MTLDARPSDAELLRRAGHRDARRMINPGDPDGPLVTAPRTHRAAPKAGRMNKLEAAYADRLDLLKKAGRITDWKYGAISLRLADRTWYRPDFLIGGPSMCEIHEVKGHWEDDARVKFKVAAELYPMFTFRAIRRVNGEWIYETPQVTLTR